jgi:hypothetical protein
MSGWRFRQKFETEGQKMSLLSDRTMVENFSSIFSPAIRKRLSTLAALFLSAFAVNVVFASDHLDSPSTVANPQADIADVYAWMSSEGRLNLAMTIQGHSLSDKLVYTLHVDSGKTFGHTTASTAIVCRFSIASSGSCQVGDADTASGDLTNLAGVEGRNGRFRVYAGRRDDPFYNNIKGLVSAYQVANTAVKNGTLVDTAGCANFDAATTQSIRAQMSSTDGGPAQNFLYKWTVSAIVISVDVDVVATGGKLLAVWGSTSQGSKQLDRMARPFVGNTLLGVAPFSNDDASGQRRQEYNEVLPGNAVKFVGDLQKSLAFQDSLDGKCGNQILAEREVSSMRYQALATVFADDRLWVNAASKVCTQFFAVELWNLAGQKASRGDCGGRSPTYDTSNVWRSLLIAGTIRGITDGLLQDEHPPSARIFPFLAPPDPNGIDH